MPNLVILGIVGLGGYFFWTYLKEQARREIKRRDSVSSSKKKITEELEYDEKSDSYRPKK